MFFVALVVREANRGAPRSPLDALPRSIQEPGSAFGRDFQFKFLNANVDVFSLEPLITTSSALGGSVDGVFMVYPFL